MYILLGALAVSIVGLAILISLKSYELRSGKALFKGRFIEASDRKIEGVIDWLRDEEIRRSVWQKVLIRLKNARVRASGLVKAWIKLIRKRQTE